MNGDKQTHQTATERAVRRNSLLFSPGSVGRSVFCELAPAQLYASGTTLFKQGAFPQEVYCINRGLVKLVNLSREGQESLLSLRSSGWILEAVPVMIQEPNLVTAVTLTDCRLHRIPATDFLHLVTDSLPFSSYLHQLHSYEIQDYLAKLVRLKSLSARKRLERLLLQLAFSEDRVKRQEPVRIHTPLKHWEIAQLISITPQHLSRLLKEMEQEGMISRDRGWLVVCDFEKLRTSVDYSTR